MVLAFSWGPEGLHGDDGFSKVVWAGESVSYADSLSQNLRVVESHLFQERVSKLGVLYNQYIATVYC